MHALLSFFVFIFIPSWQVQWKNDSIQIPLLGHAESYRFIPEATLYINGIETKDPLMYYETNGVERTFFQTINTSVVRTYSIKYRAIFPSYHYQSVHTITFEVVDLIAPKFLQIPTFEMALGQKMPDLTIGLLYEDNYYSNPQLKLNVDISAVILTMPGVYPILFRLLDPSGNEAIGYSKLHVKDLTPPEIILKKPIILNYQELFEVSTFFTFKDNYDKHLTIKIEDENVNYQKLGRYLITITVTDKSGNQSKLEDYLTIIDKEPPKIILSNRPKVLEVNEEVTQALLLSFILNVSDNYDSLTLDDMTIYHDIESHILGTYDVYYELKDQSNNVASLKVRFSIRDSIRPEIILIEPLIFDVFDPIPFFETMIEVKDNHTAQTDIKIKITHQVKMNVIGRYPITFVATDLSGNSTTLNLYVEILDRIAPVIEQINEIVISDFKKIPIKNYFDISDQYDKPGTLTFEVDDKDVNYEKIGKYPIEIMVRDASKNQTILKTNLLVVDIIDPILVLTHSSITVQQHTTWIDLRDYISHVSDNYDYLTIEDVIIIESVLYHQIGRYLVIYGVEDSSGNSVEKVLEIIVDDYIRPVIKVESMIVYQHQIVDLKKGVDLSDNHKPVTLYWFPKTIDTSIPGSWIVTYIVQDDRGNYTLIDRKIDILPEVKSFAVKDYLPVMGVSLSGLMGIIGVLYKYKRRLF